MPIHIVVPQLGESVLEARVAKWLKNEGDRVDVGEPVVELETDKIDLEVGAQSGGVLASIKRQSGEDVHVGDVLGVIEEQAPADIPVAPPAETPPSAPADTPKSSAESHLRAQPTSSPVVTHSRRAESAPVRAAPAQPSSERREERIRMSKRRLTIARNLVQVQRSAAMLTTFNEVDMSAVRALRAAQKEAFKERHGVSLGITSFFVKAAVAALKTFPRLNAEIQGEEMVIKHYYDIGIAVGASQGLVVPVIRDADDRSFAEIEKAIHDFASRAEAGRLTLDDLRGGTFTITNGGIFGSLLSTPILNPPQVGILGLHKIEDRPIAMAGEVSIRPMMYVALTYDHRIVDGLEAVQFLVRLKAVVDDPFALLLEN